MCFGDFGIESERKLVDWLASVLVLWIRKNRLLKPKNNNSCYDVFSRYSTIELSLSEQTWKLITA